MPKQKPYKSKLPELQEPKKKFTVWDALDVPQKVAMYGITSATRGGLDNGVYAKPSEIIRDDWNLNNKHLGLAYDLTLDPLNLIRAAAIKQGIYMKEVIPKVSNAAKAFKAVKAADDIEDIHSTYPEDPHGPYVKTQQIIPEYNMNKQYKGGGRVIEGLRMPSYTTRIPMQDSVGNTFYATPRTTMNMKDPRFEQINDNTMIYRDPKLFKDHGNFNLVEIDGTTPHFRGDSRGDQSAAKRIMFGSNYDPVAAYMKANGGYMSYANGGMIPSYLPQYGMGSWFRKNIGDIGSIGGKIMTGVGGVLAMTGVGAPLGAALMGAGALATGLGDNYNAKQDAAASEQDQITQFENTKKLTDEQNASNLAQSKLSAYNNSQGNQPNMNNQFVSTFAANGGFLNQASKNIDQNPLVTEYDNGGTHESNPNGGIILGNRGRVEEGELKVKLSKGDYIFSNRF